MTRPLLVVFALFFATDFFTSCNKSDPGPTALASADSISGILTSTHVVVDSVDWGSPFEAEVADARFFTTPGGAKTTLVENVLANRYPLLINYDSSGYTFVDVVNGLATMAGNCNWHVIDNNVIPNFSFTYSVPYPTFTGTLPDTITRSAGAVFHFNFGDADSAIISFAPDTTLLWHESVSRKFPGNSTTQTFSASDLAVLRPSFPEQNPDIRLRVFKSSLQVFDGKVFAFSKIHEHFRRVWVR